MSAAAVQCCSSPAPGTFSDGSSHSRVGQWSRGWVKNSPMKSDQRVWVVIFAFTSRSSLFQYPATGTELSRRAEIKVHMTLGAEVILFVYGKTVKGREIKILATSTLHGQPYYWQNKHWLAQQCLHPLSPGLVAIVTCLGDEYDILDSREKDFDSSDTSPEAQCWSQRCDCISLFISLAWPEWLVACCSAVIQKRGGLSSLQPCT